MQLRTARLCLDCEELHDAQQCPICASEAFASISRWVPAPERRGRPRPATSRDADIYRRLITAEPDVPSSGARLLKQGALGLTAVGLVAAWFFRNAGRRPSRTAPRHRGPEHPEHPEHPRSNASSAAMPHGGDARPPRTRSGRSAR